MPRNDFSSLRFGGGDMLLMVEIFAGSGVVPSCDST